jgi:hypothetical protein
MAVQWLLSLGVDGQNHFLLQHSFPKIPNDVEDRYYRSLWKSLSSFFFSIAES